MLNADTSIITIWIECKNLHQKMPIVHCGKMMEKRKEGVQMVTRSKFDRVRLSMNALRTFLKRMLHTTR
ncbi:hypothetical protein BpHYR1_028766 [Brachionus plicatilis]|uniref:Uncharacterized protein n=1 Tax=Brachionus plicatilis TaxID=10195 RepID=A0A3M7RSV4_BRAPC|nr:hypothetical protein BpHYR1_028766 [Brachionus plicatilis]